MIEEQAQVVDIKDRKLVLQAQTQSACGGCAARKGCGTSLLSKVVGRKFTQFYAENNINAKVGDTVVVGINEESLLKGSIVMYIIPVLSMLMFALLADHLLESSVSQRDLLIAVSTLSGLALGSLCSKWYFDRQSSITLYTPVVLRKIIDLE
ncbi:MAG TPA: polyurethanase [Gammaproteobacteria bacterium]|nr:polyurethanase [Gammaproteobacteria bacterium]